MHFNTTNAESNKTETILSLLDYEFPFLQALTASQNRQNVTMSHLLFEMQQRKICLAR